MRKAISVALFVLGVTTVGFAQEQGKFRVGLDFGYAMPDGGGGVLVALEPKYNIADDMNLGLRFESAAMGKNISGGGLSIESEVTASTAIMGTFDKYFNNGSSSFAPFVGAGIGYNTLANIEVEVLESTSESEVDGKLGGFFRAGFELGKLRLAATYNLMGKSELEGGGEVKNSYFSVSLGFYLGGGKWGR